MIKFSQKWTGIIFIILNSKLGIGICSQPIIYETSQSNLYDVIILHHTIFFPTRSTNYILLIYSAYSSSGLWTFWTSTKILYFPLHLSLTRDYHKNNTCTIFSISKFVSPRTSFQHTFPRRDISSFSKEDKSFNGLDELITHKFTGEASNFVQLYSRPTSKFQSSNGTSGIVWI